VQQAAKEQETAPALDKSPEAFLVHAERVLSVTLQVGNAAAVDEAAGSCACEHIRRIALSLRSPDGPLLWDWHGRMQRLLGCELTRNACVLRGR
jgi:hypothetical protein